MGKVNEGEEEEEGSTIDNNKQMELNRFTYADKTQFIINYYQHVGIY